VNIVKSEITENLVVNIWQHQIVTNLFTDTGEPVRIIFPGRTCTGGGCDLQDAVFTIGDKVVMGNIEVHVKSSQWYSHGHHRDGKYNDVALHVVMWHDFPLGTVLQNGKVIPTISLSPFLVYPLNKLRRKINLCSGHLPTCPAITRLSTRKPLTELLNAAGKERFATKTALMRKDLMKQDADQVLFRNISRALGYDKNTVPFETLADRLTFRALKEVRDKRNARQALILGIAGLLPSQRLRIKHKLVEDSEIDELETMWQSNGITATMNQSDWCFFRVRPNNFPTRRLVALSYLVNRYCQAGLLRGILNLIREAHIGKLYSCIEDGLIVFGQGYWEIHSDFGIAMARNTALLGRSKAAEMTINMLLPFVCAWGELAAEPELKVKATNIYFSYPKLEDNQLIRFMRQQLLLNLDTKLSALQQQGLIHIFKTYCRYRNCLECPVSVSQG
jgi:hypothetical protein